MLFRVVLHPAAEAELDVIYEHVRAAAGAVRAGLYLSSLYDFIGELEAFPKRGTVRESLIPDLRIIGFRRRISIAFTVESDTVLILGVFSGGRSIGLDLIEGRV